ncbi:cyd operon YbgE family protein [Granulosicoccaceae sp. 1_MG-2023]|nr:cyd operon YbgE family protein [Granulosicoccaceae sp. 1_MG-2023]
MAKTDDTAAPATIAWLPLMAAIIITLAITADPRLLADSTGKADHTAAMALFWAMSAGFTRGVGFIPRHPVLAWLLSTPACLAGIAIAVLRLL